MLRAVIIYAGLLLALRLFGKREVGQFTLYDLVFVLLVANALQPAMTGPDTSLAGGAVAASTLLLRCRRIRVIGQCKAKRKKVGPNYIRELEGVVYRFILALALARTRTCILSSSSTTTLMM